MVFTGSHVKMYEESTFFGKARCLFLVECWVGQDSTTTSEGARYGCFSSGAKGFVGDEILPSYVGILMNNYKDPY